MLKILKCLLAHWSIYSIQLFQLPGVTRFLKILSFVPPFDKKLVKSFVQQFLINVQTENEACPPPLAC